MQINWLVSNEGKILKYFKKIINKIDSCADYSSTCRVMWSTINLLDKLFFPRSELKNGCFIGYWMLILDPQIHHPLFHVGNAADISLFKFNNRNTTKMFEIRSKLIIKIPKWRLCWSLFSIMFQAWRPATLLKRDSNTDVFLLPLLLILNIFQTFF